ncbi:MAG: HK97 family phage prohead protease, partial [Defluviitaleaceae bacterium]|nr:HK97 family phage prohead protease [Defluviitaleaceae bacterium]
MIHEKIEKRQFIFDAEMRAMSDEKMEVEGYALKFDKATTIGGRYGWSEKISKTALDEADLSDVVFNFNHDINNILAGTRNSSLDLIIDNIGLKINARITDTSIGR